MAGPFLLIRFLAGIVNKIRRFICRVIFCRCEILFYVFHVIYLVDTEL